MTGRDDDARALLPSLEMQMAGYERIQLLGSLEAKNLNIVALIEQSLNKKRMYARWSAIIELTRRALNDDSLLSAACTAIGCDGAVKLHYSPAGGWIAAVEILISRNEYAVRHLLLEVDTWKDFDQENIIRHCAGNKNVAKATLELMQVFGWQPKYSIKNTPEEELATVLKDDES